MKNILRYLSYAGLLLSIVPALLLFAGKIDRPTYGACMVLGTILWFGGAFFWVKRPEGGE